MFRGEGSGYTERVDVIGTRKFMELVDQLERDEDMKLDEFTLGKDKLVVTQVMPDAAKTDKDIQIPTLTPILVRKKTLAEEIAAIDVRAFNCQPFPMKEGTAEARNFRYEGLDIVTLEKIVARYVTVDLFVKALRAVVIEQQAPQVVAARRVSETPAFPYSRSVFPAAKTVFNVVAPDNECERRFARFLQDAPDVAAFAKLPPQFGFAIEYTGSAASRRYYEPDFVAVLTDGSHRLVETKEREDPDVPHKDCAARLWCENATSLTGVSWRYLKVSQTGFDALQPTGYADLLVFEHPA